MLYNYETAFLAEKQRRTWGIDNYSPIDIFSIVLEKFDNMSIIWLELDESLGGCCTNSNGEYIVVINSIHSRGMQNFTLAHELYHLLFDEINEINCCNLNEEYDDVEKEANNFAFSLLIPNCALHEFIVENNIDQWQLKDIIKCEQYFHIGHNNMLSKLKKEHMISEEEYEKYNFDVVEKASKLGFDTALYNSGWNNHKFYTLGNIIPLTKKAYDENKISKGLCDEIFIHLFRSDVVYEL